MSKKEFDSVELMRSIRNKKHIEYESNPQLRNERLAEIRDRYKNILKTKEYSKL